MKGKYKKLITDINRGADIDNNLNEYVRCTCSEYNCYSTVKLSMNFYTMKESILELEDKNTDVCKYFQLITDLISKHVINREVVDDKAIECIDTIRRSVEYKMKNLTAYTDGYEIYEYILNRIEAGIKGGIEEVNPELLADKMFKYVFSENDTVVINSKLQLLMAQLPVRMTKVKFFDIISNTLNIYESGEKTSVDEFVDMLRTASLINKPAGFETEYPFLYHVYRDLCDADYKNISEEQFNNISERLSQAATIINNEVSLYMLLQEIINDVYALLLTMDIAYDCVKDKPGYRSAVSILTGCVNRDDFDEMVSEMMENFISIEGIQEDVYENIIILEAAMPDIRQINSDKINELSLGDYFDRMNKVSKLLSTSLFIDLDKDYTGESGEMAGHEYIVGLRDALIGELTELFNSNSRVVVRSIMCKLLSAMPIFMNTQQEIQDYFSYVLNNCKDDSELTACNRLICEMIEEDTN